MNKGYQNIFAVHFVWRHLLTNPFQTGHLFDNFFQNADTSDFVSLRDDLLHDLDLGFSGHAGYG